MNAFFFSDTATTEIYTLSLHDALPISLGQRGHEPAQGGAEGSGVVEADLHWGAQRRGHHLSETRSKHPGNNPCGHRSRSEEHTSELQSRQYLVCRLLLEKNTRSLFSRP